MPAPTHTLPALTLAVTLLSTIAPAAAQKAWAAPSTFGLAASESSVNPGIDLANLLPEGMDKNIGAWDWLSDDKVVFTNWVWNFSTTPLSDIWVMEGMKTQDRARITVKRYYPGNLREALGVKVVNGEVYVAVKFALLKFTDANKDGIAEDTVRIVEFPNRPEPADGWNNYSLDLKYRGGFFYVALPSQTRGPGLPAYPIMPGRGTVAKIDPVKKTLEYIASGLRTPDGLGWGPDSALFVTDNQGAWLPSSKLIHATGGRFFGLQPVEAGDPSLTETPPAIWMPHGEASSSPTQPVMLEKGPFAGQMLVGDNVLGVVNRVSLEKVAGEFQGALYHFTGGLTCGTHRLLLNPAGDVYLGGLGSPINTWNVKGHYVGMQIARFNGKPGFEVKEILSRADGFTLRFTAPAGVSAGDPANYRLRQWRYQPTKEYGGQKLDNVALTVTAATLDPSKNLVHLAVTGLAPGRVVDFQFHRDLQSESGQSIWTGEAWYTLNKVSTEKGLGSVSLRPAAAAAAWAIVRLQGGIEMEIPDGYGELRMLAPNGRVLWSRPARPGTLRLERGALPSGLAFLELRGEDGAAVLTKVLSPF